jgi:hypothetical protein
VIQLPRFFETRFKSPNVAKTFVMDLTPYLGTGGVTISTLVSVFLTPAGPATVQSSVLSGSKIAAKIAGGVDGDEYLVTARFTRSDGDTDERSFKLEIAET